MKLRIVNYKLGRGDRVSVVDWVDWEDGKLVYRGENIELKEFFEKFSDKVLDIVFKKKILYSRERRVSGKEKVIVADMEMPYPFGILEEDIRRLVKG